MDWTDYLPWLLALAAVLAAIILVWRDRRRTRRILTKMDALLDQAISGDFAEEDFDETLLSAVETKLARFLLASAISSRNLTEEKERVKELIADVSHQTKTPMANILLYAQLLQEQDLPEESRSCVAALNSQADKLNFLISTLVKISRLEAGVFVFAPVIGPVQLLVDKVMDQAAPLAAAKGLLLSAEATPAQARFDGKWTSEALFNIVDNAIKYTPAGGRVEMKVSVYELFVRVDVADTGIGIPEDEQADIFRRFYRSPRTSQAEGVGVGLYLARQIVSGQGGYIKVASRPGEGAVFSLFLPRE